MLRLALLIALGLACLLVYKLQPEPRALVMIEDSERPAVEAPRFEPPAPKVEAPREEVEAPREEVEAPVEPWSIVTLRREHDALPWLRATHDFKEHLSLPRSAVRETMAAGEVVVIGTDGMYFAGRRVATIAYGVILDRDTEARHLIPALKQPLAAALETRAAPERGADPPRPSTVVALFADADTRFGILVDVIYTSGQAGATDYEIAVKGPGEPSELGSDVLRISPPKYVTGTTTDARVEPGAGKTALVMEVSPTEVRIGRHVPYDPTRSAWLARISLEGERAAAMRRITALARETVARERWEPLDIPTVLFSADPYVPLELLVAALAAATGPDCTIEALIDADRRRCLFLRRVVHAGSAAPPELAGD
jgi:hypothetical protein